METIRYDTNCLQDARIDTRWKALQRVKSSFENSQKKRQENPESDEVETYSKEMIVAILKMLEDKRDRHREGACQLVTSMLKYLTFECMEWVLPVAVARLGMEPAVEQSEPVRLELLEMMNSCLETFPHDIAKRGFLDYFATVLCVCLKDADPEMKMLCSKCVLSLCSACREQTKPVAINIAKAMKPNLRVKQWKVRQASIKAFGALVANGALEIIYDFRDEANELQTTLSFMKTLSCDRSEAVRSATLDVISELTMEIVDRIDTHRHFMPLILLSMTDDLESIRKKSQQILLGLSAFYEMDNEDNRIDLENRRITLKDIKWYADDTYPDMTMVTKSTLPGTDLTSRPPIGARLVVADCCRTFIPKLLSDINSLEWNIPNSTLNRRIVAIRTLITTLWFIETNSLQYMQSILDSLYKVLRDDDPVVRNESYFCLELIGKLHTPDNYIPLILTSDSRVKEPIKAEDEMVEHREVRRRTMTIFSTTANTTQVSILIAFKYLLLGTVVLTREQAETIILALTSDDVVVLEAPELLMALLQLFRTCQQTFVRFGLLSSSQQQHVDPQEGNTADGTMSLDFEIFYTLLTIQSCEDQKVVAEAENVLSELSEIVTGDPHGLYLRHFLASLTPKNKEDNKIPVSVFSKLLQYGGPRLKEFTVQVCETFLTQLYKVRYDVDAKFQLKYMTLLHDFILSTKQYDITLPNEQVEQILRIIIIPNSKWHAGGSSSLFRKVSLGALGSLLVQGLIEFKVKASNPDDEDEVKECTAAQDLLTEVADCWRNSLDSDDSELRLVVTKMSPFIFRLPLLSPESTDGMRELINRLDDSNDVIRTQTATSVEHIFSQFRSGSLPPSVTSALAVDKVPDYISSLLLHMDDPCLDLKTELCNCLIEVKRSFPDLVVQQARAVRDKHSTTRHIDLVLEAK